MPCLPNWCGDVFGQSTHSQNMSIFIDFFDAFFPCVDQIATPPKGQTDEFPGMVVIS
jgi:hypothetical protein